MAHFLSRLNDSYDQPAERHPLHKWHIVLLILLILGTAYAIRQRNATPSAPAAVADVWEQSQTQRCEGSVFGTFYHITYQADKDYQDSIDVVLAEVDNSLSPFNKRSIITAVNEGRDTTVNKMFTDVFTLAKTIYTETDGAFDITVAPLVNLWGFGFKNMDHVSQTQVDSLLKFVGFDSVQLRDGKVIKQHPETMLDCSAIAKGYGVDAVGIWMEQNGIKNYMVEIGGEIRVRGHNPKGQDWSIAITRPEDDTLGQQNDIEQVLSVTDIAMATSGNYRNFYVKDGKKYAHTINPHTGTPVQHSILSSTVLTDDCATADAYATSFMVLGLEEAKKVLNAHPELMAFFVYSTPSGETDEWYSPKLEKLLRK
ncbi:MAG: FAD:protein FMN transferase [Bacteroidaceae bacterium]|nr:FAD:protein FMN transferase [Bacteroidaceae bacterium]